LVSELIIRDLWKQKEENSRMKEYFEQSLLLMTDSDLISLEAIQKLIDIKETLVHNFQVGQVFRSRWEMENSVLNDIKFPTPDAKYWQSVREQQVHFQELTMSSYEYRLNAEKVKLYEAQLDQQLGALEEIEEHSIEYRKAEAKANMVSIKAEKLRYMMLNQQRTARDRIREILSWDEIMKRLGPQMEHGIDSYEDHQPLSYQLRFKREMEAARGSSQSPSEARNLQALHQMANKVMKNEQPSIVPSKKLKSRKR